MTVGIVDTTVVIHYFRKLPAAVMWVDSQPERLSVTALTQLEILYGSQSKAGQAANEAALTQFDIEYVTVSDQVWAVEQMRQFRLSHGVDINDCLIAAVAHRLQVPLYTHNVRHMSVMLGSGLVIKPY